MRGREAQWSADALCSTSSVIKASKVTGVLDTWCVGPRFSRGMKVHDLEAYVMLASRVLRSRGPAARVRRRSGFSWLLHDEHRAYRVVNMILGKSYGLHVSLEDIRFL